MARGVNTMNVFVCAGANTGILEEMFEVHLFRSHVGSKPAARAQSWTGSLQRCGFTLSL